MPPTRRPATILNTSVIGSISSTAPRGRRSETRLQLPDDRLALPGGKQLRQVVRERGEPGGDLALALPRLEQLVRDVERGQNRRLMRLHDGALREHLLERLVHVRRDIPGVLGRQVGPHRVLIAPDHHLDRVFLGTHGAAPAPEAPAARPPPLPPESRACSSRNVSRDSRSCTRRRAASTRCRSVLFSCSRSDRRPRASRSALTPPAPPRAPLSFNSASALRARVRQPVSSSATCRRIVSSWSSTGPSALSPSYAKLVLQSSEPPCQRRVHFRLAQRARRVAEGAVPRDAALTGRNPGPTILVEHLEALEQRAHGPLQHLGHLRRAHPPRQHQRHVALDRRLHRKRTIPHLPPARQRQADLEPEQRSRPHRGIRVERAGPTQYHPTTPFHRLPPHRPAACRFHVTAG